MLEDAALRWPLEQCERVEAIGLRALEKIITTLSLNLENVVNWIKLHKSMGEYFRTFFMRLKAFMAKVS